MDRPPLVSLIIAVRNAVGTVERSLTSAFAQTHPNIEIVVIDGASTDGTREIVAGHAARLAWWCSEPDSGIADAWNKGLARTAGGIVVLLNADDELHSEFCARAAAVLDPARPMIAYGDTLLLDATGRTTLHCHGMFDPGCLDRGFGFWHTSCAATRTAYDAIGPFDASLRIAIDTDWLLRAFRASVPFVRHEGCNYMRLGGISTRRHHAAWREYSGLLAKYGLPGGSGPRRWRSSMAAVVVQCIGFSRWLCWRRQLALAAISLFHLAYALTPSWRLRRSLLALWGVSLGTDSAIHTPMRLLSRGRLEIGQRSLINRDCVIDNRMSIRIGDDVSIAQGVRIFTLGHDVDDAFFASRGAAIEVGDRVVVFAGAMLMPGCRLGRGAVVLPGAVVTGEVEPWSVVGGVPARTLRKRSEDQRYVLDRPYHFQV